MGLLDFFKTHKPYCLQVKIKDAGIKYISNLFISKEPLIDNKNRFIDMYGCVHGEAVETDTVSGRQSRCYYYYEFCDNIENAKRFPHISKMSDSERHDAKIVFMSAKDAGYECQFVFYK